MSTEHLTQPDRDANRFKNSTPVQLIGNMYLILSLTCSMLQCRIVKKTVDAHLAQLYLGYNTLFKKITWQRSDRVQAFRQHNTKMILLALQLVMLTVPNSFDNILFKY